MIGERKYRSLGGEEETDGVGGAANVAGKEGVDGNMGIFGCMSLDKGFENSHEEDLIIRLRRDLEGDNQGEIDRREVNIEIFFGGRRNSIISLFIYECREDMGSIFLPDHFRAVSK